MNRPTNGRRVATRSTRANDENAAPAGSSSHHHIKQGVTRATAQKANASTAVAGKPSKATDAGVKAGIKRERNVLGAVTNIRQDNVVEARNPAAKPTGRNEEARQPLASRNQANQPNRQIAPVPRTRQQQTYARPSRQEEMMTVSDMDVDRVTAEVQYGLEDLVDIDDDATERGGSDGELDEDDFDEEDWLRMSGEEEMACQEEIDAVRETFRDEIDLFDTTMVAEYADEIFAHMEELEQAVMPNPRYMEFQTEIEWTMRTTLIDWLLQVHLRYHMLPETLWIAVNLVDRFLSVRVVSLNKLQLVGVTAMFIAAKYEEILAPSVDEFVYMTENGYTKEEILKGERIILQTLDFAVSPYCSPYSWVRRISKADDYDIQTRTLSKFLMEVTLLDHRFLRCKPSMIAAVGMYLARKMLGGDWNDPFVYYSNFTEGHLVSAAIMLCERLVEPGFDKVYVYKKYANKKFLRASTFACDWAHNHAAETFA